MQKATEDKLQQVFRDALNLPAEVVTFAHQANHADWDSLAHVVLVAAIESEFEIQIDAGDSLTLTSYAAAVSYLEGRGL